MAAEEGQVISCHTQQEWVEHFQKGIESKRLVVVYFTAAWCPPCRFISPILTEYAKKHPHVIFLKVDVDELNLIAEEWSVEAMPTFVFLKEGKEVDRCVGAEKEKLLKRIEEHATVAGVSASA